MLFLAYALPPYVGLDPAQARLAQPAGAPWSYPALVAHIGFGSTALLTAVLHDRAQPGVDGGGPAGLRADLHQAVGRRRG